MKQREVLLQFHTRRVQSRAPPWMGGGAWNTTLRRCANQGTIEVDVGNGVAIPASKKMNKGCLL